MMNWIKNWLGIKPSIAERDREIMKEFGSCISMGIRKSLEIPTPSNDSVEFDELIRDIKNKCMITTPQHQQSVDIPNNLEINGHRFIRVENDENE